MSGFELITSGEVSVVDIKISAPVLVPADPGDSVVVAMELDSVSVLPS